jgi:dihydrofolate reductase
MGIALVVAMSREGVIGREGQLPWRLPRDLKRFREVTWGKPIVMGRKTFESLGRPLPGRTNIVLTRQPDYKAEGALVSNTSEAALKAAELAPGGSEIMVIGGADLFRLFLPQAELLHLTLVEAPVQGDTHFPGDPLQSGEWEVIHQEPWPPDDRNLLAATYFILRRRGSARPPRSEDAEAAVIRDATDPLPEPRPG